MKNAQINRFQFVNCPISDLIWCSLVLSQIDIACSGGMLIQMNRIKLVKSFETIDQSIGGLRGAFEFALGDVILHVVLEREWIISQQIDNHVKVSFKVSIPQIL